MGLHYADVTKPLAGSTIYGAYEGKPVFTEIMLTPKQLAAAARGMTSCARCPALRSTTST
jgi:hypothetical protein